MTKSKPNIIDLEQGSDEWLAFRMGKVTGSKMHSIYSFKDPTIPDISNYLKCKGIKFKASARKAELIDLIPDGVNVQDLGAFEPKKTAWETAAERLIIRQPEDEPSAMERGKELEQEAIDQFEKNARQLPGNFKIHRSPVVRSRQHSRFIVSMDGLMEAPDHTELAWQGLEVKCKDPGNHLMAYETQVIPPGDTMAQVASYFMVEPLISRVYLIFYDPRFVDSQLKLFWLIINRREFGHCIDKYEAGRIAFEAWADKITDKYKGNF